jgi:hypothetical protein
MGIDPPIQRTYHMFSSKDGRDGPSHLRLRFLSLGARPWKPGHRKWWPETWRRLSWSWASGFVHPRNWLQTSVVPGYIWYPLVNIYIKLHKYGKSQISMGKSTRDGPCSIAMLNYQRVYGMHPMQNCFASCGSYQSCPETGNGSPSFGAEIHARFTHIDWDFININQGLMDWWLGLGFATFKYGGLKVRRHALKDASGLLKITSSCIAGLIYWDY